MSITERNQRGSNADDPDRQTQGETAEPPRLRAVPAPTDDPAVDDVAGGVDPGQEIEPVIVDGELVPAPADPAVSDGPDGGPDGGVDPSTWQVDLDEEDPGAGDASVPVDAPDADRGDTAVDLPDRLRTQKVDRRPVVPPWVRDAAQRKQVASWYAEHAAYTTKYHAVRVPKYAGRLLARSPRGAARVVRRTGGWVFDADARPLRAEAVRKNDAEEYIRLERMRQDRVRLRLLTLAPLLLGVLLLAVVVAVAAPLVKLAVLAAAVITLGIAGANPDKPLVEPAQVVARHRKLTADIVTRAFLAAGLCKDDNPITFPAPIMRDGPGWRAVVDLPWGVTADKAVRKRVELAAGLDLDEVQVWPERVRGTTGSARRVSLWVADEDPYAKPSGTWPLVDKGTVSLFEPVAFGEDQRGSVVTVLLMFTAFLIGSVPRMGKTVAARLLVLAAALDPLVELHIYDGKGGQDWRMFEHIAARCGFGARADVVLTLLEDLRGLVADMDRRYDQIGQLPAEQCPESKITPELARKRSLRLHPVVIAIDEFQRYSEHPDHGKEIVGLLTDLAKVGPAVGIISVLATQKPDTDSIPTKLRDVIGTRFALKTMTWQASDAVLGSGAYVAGQDASRFQRPHKGVGWLLGADDTGAVEEALTVRTYGAFTADAQRVVERAYALREKAGTLPTPVVDADQAQPVSLLDDLLAVLPAGEDRAWSQTLLDRLVELRPDHYAGWSTSQLGNAVKPYGLTTKQVWLPDPATSKKTNRWGLLRADLLTAIEARNGVSTPTP
ncbi:MAG: cell division protein FtsK [Pseudonocardiaceae bacterium]|nr:cell division protein FtsK [Pseudonocardiaceae bacterium]